MDAMRITQPKFGLNITTKILMLVIGLALTLAGFGAYSSYSINFLKIQTEQLNSVETAIEEHVNKMNAGLLESSNFLSKVSLDSILRGAGIFKYELDKREPVIKKHKEFFDSGLLKSEALRAEAKTNLDEASQIIKDAVESYGYETNFKSKLIEKIDNYLYASSSNERKKYINKMNTAIDALGKTYEQIIDAQDKLSYEVSAFYDFLTTTALDTNGDEYKNKFNDFSLDIINANSKVAISNKNLQEIIRSGSYVNLFREVRGARDYSFNLMRRAQAISAMVTVIVGLAATMSALVFGFFIASGIRKKLSNAFATIDSIRNGNLTKDIQISGNDEISKLLVSTSEMRHNIFEVVSAMTKVAAQISENASKLNITADQVSDGTSQQATSVQETSASMNEMAQNIAENAKNASETDATAKLLASNSETCSASMKKTSDAMSNIFERIGIVGEITRKIELLALNASVEAARAGEHGKGFAVVASEVSKLAELSKEAALDIERSSTEGKKLADLTNQMLNELLPEIEKTQQLVQNISASSKEQSIGADQINDAIKTLDNVVQVNAVAASDLSQAANGLSKIVPELTYLINKFQIEEHPNRAGSSEDLEENAFDFEQEHKKGKDVIHSERDNENHDFGRY